MANEKRLIDVMRIDLDDVDISDCTDVDDIFAKIEDLLDAQPTVDAVEVVHGRWKTIEGREYLGCLCSNCQKWSDAKTNYCPNCGASMKGGNEDG